MAFAFFVLTSGGRRVIKTGTIQNCGKRVIFWGIFQGVVLVFGVKMGIGVLRYNDWARQAKQKRSKTFENVRKIARNV